MAEQERVVQKKLTITYQIKRYRCESGIAILALRGRGGG